MYALTYSFCPRTSVPATIERLEGSRTVWLDNLESLQADIDIVLTLPGLQEALLGVCRDDLEVLRDSGSDLPTS